MSNAFSRLVVAAIGLPVVLGVAYLGGWWMFALVTAAAAIALHEYFLMARELRPLTPAGWIGGGLALAGAETGGLRWMVGGALLSLALAFLLKTLAETRTAATIAVSGTLMGTIWVAVGLGFLILIRQVPEHGRLALFTVMLAVWAGDTFAYFGGRLLGRHKLAPSTSPGKTWEGLVFGTAATVFVAFVALYKQDFLTIGESLVLGAVIAVAAPIGDLFESLLKRDAGVKDSGTLLGGHGGMLDRLDAFLFAAPAAYYCLVAFGHA